MKRLFDISLEVLTVILLGGSIVLLVFVGLKIWG